MIAFPLLFQFLFLFFLFITFDLQCWETSVLFNSWQRGLVSRVLAMVGGAVRLMFFVQSLAHAVNHECASVMIDG